MAGKPHQLGNLANLGHNPPPLGLEPYSGGGGASRYRRPLLTFVILVFCENQEGGEGPMVGVGGEYVKHCRRDFFRIRIYRREYFLNYKTE